jgi:hypothetical protein
LVTNFSGKFAFGSGYVINSGSGSGTLRLGRKIPLLFEQKGLKQVVWNVRLKKWLLNGRAYLFSLLQELGALKNFPLASEKRMG